jgi:hypothetical protein
MLKEKVGQTEEHEEGGNWGRLTAKLLQMGVVKRCGGSGL